MEEKSTKRSWKIAVVVLAVLIIAVLAAVVGVFVTSLAAGGGEKEESSSKKAKLEQVQPSGDEVAVKSTIQVSSDGSASSEAADDRKAGSGEASTENHRYEVVNQRMTWAEAVSYCNAQGGYLATVGSQQEYEKLIELANQSGRKVLFLGAQRGSDGNFQWINGEEFSFTAWMQGEPNNDGGNENCLVMFLVNNQWVWADVPNDLSPYYGADAVGFICEWDS